MSLDPDVFKRTHFGDLPLIPEEKETKKERSLPKKPVPEKEEIIEKEKVTDTQRESITQSVKSKNLSEKAKSVNINALAAGETPNKLLSSQAITKASEALSSIGEDQEQEVKKPKPFEKKAVKEATPAKPQRIVRMRAEDKAAIKPSNSSTRPLPPRKPPYKIPPSQRSTDEQKKEEAILGFVDRHLHKYLIGEITRATEDPNRKPLMDQVKREDFYKKEPDKETLQERIFNAYIQTAVRQVGINIAQSKMTGHMQTNYTYEDLVNEYNSREHGNFKESLAEALKKDFPEMRSLNDEELEEKIFKAFEAMVEGNQ